jgi:hypothetical protein
MKRIGAHKEMKDKAVLATYRQLHAQKKQVLANRPQPEARHWRRWRELTKPRRHKDFESLPAGVQDKLIAMQGLILRYDPHAQMKLIGSWVHGGWVDEQTPAEILQLRQLIKGKRGLSDIDLLVQSRLDLNLSALAAEAGYNMSIIKGEINRQKGILLPPMPKIAP